MHLYLIKNIHKNQFECQLSFLIVCVGAVFEERDCRIEAQVVRARAASQGHNGESKNLQSH